MAQAGSYKCALGELGKVGQPPVFVVPEQLLGLTQQVGQAPPTPAAPRLDSYAVADSGTAAAGTVPGFPIANRGRM